MIKKKVLDELKFHQKLLADQRGQVDLIGNTLSILEKQPWILLVLFLAGVYFTTFKLSFLGVEFGLSNIITGVLSPVFGIFHFGFDWRLIVIIIFFSIPVTFIFKYGWANRR